MINLFNCTFEEFVKTIENNPNLRNARYCCDEPLLNILLNQYYFTASNKRLVELSKQITWVIENKNYDINASGIQSTTALMICAYSFDLLKYFFNKILKERADVIIELTNDLNADVANMAEKTNQIDVLYLIAKHLNILDKLDSLYNLKFYLASMRRNAIKNYYNSLT